MRVMRLMWLVVLSVGAAAAVAVSVVDYCFYDAVDSHNISCDWLCSSDFFVVVSKAFDELLFFHCNNRMCRVPVDLLCPLLLLLWLLLLQPLQTMTTRQSLSKNDCCCGHAKKMRSVISTDADGCGLTVHVGHCDVLPLTLLPTDSLLQLCYKLIFPVVKWTNRRLIASFVISVVRKMAPFTVCFQSMYKRYFWNCCQMVWSYFFQLRWFELCQLLCVSVCAAWGEDFYFKFWQKIEKKKMCKQKKYLNKWKELSSVSNMPV